MFQFMWRLWVVMITLQLIGQASGLRENKLTRQIDNDQIHGPRVTARQKSLVNGIKDEQIDILSETATQRGLIGGIKDEEIDILRETATQRGLIGGIKDEEIDILSETATQRGLIGGIKDEEIDILRETATQRGLIGGIKDEEIDILRETATQRGLIGGIKDEEIDILSETATQRGLIGGIKDEQIDILRETATQRGLIGGIKDEEIDILRETATQRGLIGGIKDEQIDILSETATQRGLIGGIKDEEIDGVSERHTDGLKKKDTQTAVTGGDKDEQIDRLSETDTQISLTGTVKGEQKDRVGERHRYGNKKGRRTAVNGGVKDEQIDRVGERHRDGRKKGRRTAVNGGVRDEQKDRVGERHRDGPKKGRRTAVNGGVKDEQKDRLSETDTQISLTGTVKDAQIDRVGERHRYGLNKKGRRTAVNGGVKDEQIDRVGERHRYGLKKKGRRTAVTGGVKDEQKDRLSETDTQISLTGTVKGEQIDRVGERHRYGNKKGRRTAVTGGVKDEVIDGGMDGQTGLIGVVENKDEMKDWKTDEDTVDKYEYRLSVEGKVLVITFCELKSTLKTKTKHFHKDKCILRHLQMYSKKCMYSTTLGKRKTKSCIAYKRKLKISSKPLTETRLLLNDDMLADKTEIRDKNYFLCGSRNDAKIWYNRKNSLCCNGKIFETTGQEHCCGKTIANKTGEICCQDNTYHRTSEDEACCGDVVYDRSTHFCNDGHVHQLGGNVTELPENVTKRFIQQYEENDVPSIELESQTLPEDKPTSNGVSKHFITGLSAVIAIAVLGAISIVIVKMRRGCIKGTHENTKTSEVTTEPSSMPAHGSSIAERLAKDYTMFGSNSSFVNDSGIVNPDNTSIVNPQDENKSVNHSEQGNSSSSTTAEVYSNAQHSGETQQRSHSEENRYRRQSGESLHSTVTLNMSDFLKDIMKDYTVNEENFASNLLKEASTQTCAKKETNRRDMFGNPFQLSCFLSKENPIVKLRNSDAQMTLSDKDLSDRSIEVHASSHTALPEIRQKMNIADDLKIISPCMEYDFPGVEKFGHHAVIDLKLAGRISDQIQVWRRHTSVHTDNLSETSTVQVHVVKDHQSHLDTYCIVKNGRALVYTIVFSTYVCTRHNTNEEIDLEGVLYARMKSMPAPQVYLTLYVVETLHIEIDDYKTKLDVDEAKYEMRRIQHNKITLPESVKDTDALKVTLNIGQTDLWDFMRDPKNLDFDYGSFTLSLCNICCQKRQPARCLWPIEGKVGTQPDTSFRCYLYIKTENQPADRPLFTVDEHVPKTTCTCACKSVVRAERSMSPCCSIDHKALQPQLPHRELNSPYNYSN